MGRGPEGGMRLSGGVLTRSLGVHGCPEACGPLGSAGLFLGQWALTLALRSPQGHLHDRYGQLVSVYTRLLLTKISFHLKVGASAGWRTWPSATSQDPGRAGSTLSQP